jgi:four helix bundle protein
VTGGQVANYIENSEVFLLARQTIVSIYNVLKKFPDYEKFGLSSQMRRAAVSILSNMSEGGSRISDAEKRMFYSYARGSAAELKAQFMIAKDLNYILDQEYEDIYKTLERIHKMLTGLIKSKATNNDQQ